MLDAADQLLRGKVAVERDHPLGDVLGEIADALEVVGDAHGGDDLAQVDRHRLAPCDGEDRLLLDLALQRVGGDVRRHHPLRQGGVALDQRVDRVGDLLLGEAAHLGDFARQLLQVGVERLGSVFGHHEPDPRDSPKGQPKRPVM